MAAATLALLAFSGPAAFADTDPPPCVSAVPPPDKLSFGGHEIPIDYPRILRAKDEAFATKYAEADAEFRRWLKRKYRLTPEELLEGPGSRRIDRELVGREREKIFSAKQEEARALFDRWLKRRYAVTAEELEGVVDAYYEEAARRCAR